MLTGQDTSLQLNDIGGLLNGKSVTNNVVLSLTETAQTDGRRRAGQPARLGGRARREDRRGAGHVLQSHVQPERALGAQHASSCRTRSMPSTVVDKPALQRAYRDRYSPGSTFKVVTSKAAHRSRHRDAERPGLPRVGRLPDTRDQHEAAATSATRSAAGPSSESLIISCNATFARARLRARQRSSRPRWTQCGIDSAPPIDLAPNAVESVGPRVGARPRPVRARGHRSGRRVHLSAADGAHRRGHRQRRRDQAAARGEGDPELRRARSCARSIRSTGRRACRRPPRRRSPT